MSRAFGNRMLKPFVVAEPEIQEQKIEKKPGESNILPKQQQTMSNCYKIKETSVEESNFNIFKENNFEAKNVILGDRVPFIMFITIIIINLRSCCVAYQMAPVWSSCSNRFVVAATKLQSHICFTAAIAIHHYSTSPHQITQP